MLVNVFYCLCLSTRIDAGCYIVLIVEPVNRVERVALTSYMGIFPNLWTNPPTPGFLWDLGERKVKFGSKRAIFGVIWGGFEGFGPCLGVSHPTHPHLGEISQKKPFFFWQPPLSAMLNTSSFIPSGQKEKTLNGCQDLLRFWSILKRVLCEIFEPGNHRFAKSEIPKVIHISPTIPSSGLSCLTATYLCANIFIFSIIWSKSGLFGKF